MNESLRMIVDDLCAKMVRALRREDQNERDLCVAALDALEAVYPETVGPFFAEARNKR